MTGELEAVSSSVEAAAGDSVRRLAARFPGTAHFICHIEHMKEDPSEADRILIAKLTGIACLHARWVA